MVVPRDSVFVAPFATVHRLGDEREPIVVVDNAIGTSETLVDYAATQSHFQPAAASGSDYPGLLGPAPTSYIDHLVKLSLPLIEAHFDDGALAPLRARGNFSLVTTQPEDLSTKQRIPHIDAADRLQFAAIHYLCRAGGGTGFYRHRSTGYETVDRHRVATFFDMLDDELQRTPMPARYCITDNPLFDRIGSCDVRFDRFVLYRASLFHSGLIADVPSCAADPRRGRLTGNLFLQCGRTA